jgi:hypothetical protein
MVTSEEKKRKNGEYHTSLRDLPLGRGGADELGDGDGDYFRGPNKTDVDGSRWRCNIS